MRIVIDDQFTVGQRTPAAGELEELARDGFRSVVDLREEDEVDGGVPPREEGDRVQDMGMEYFHLPVRTDEMWPDQVDRFRFMVARMPHPIFVHCTGGVRSGLFTMMHIATKNAWSGDRAVEEARRLGLPLGDKHEARLRSYVDRFPEGPTYRRFGEEGPHPGD